MSEGAINDLAFQIGDYLANQVDPKNEQERILSDLWSVADKEEQQAIANIMVKLVQNNGIGKERDGLSFFSLFKNYVNKILLFLLSSSIKIIYYKV